MSALNSSSQQIHDYCSVMPLFSKLSLVLNFIAPLCRLISLFLTLCLVVVLLTCIHLVKHIRNAIPLYCILCDELINRLR